MSATEPPRDSRRHSRPVTNGLPPEPESALPAGTRLEVLQARMASLDHAIRVRDWDRVEFCFEMACLMLAELVHPSTSRDDRGRPRETPDPRGP